MNKEDALLLAQFNANQARIAEQEIARLRTQRDKAVLWLKFAREKVRAWGAYASPYCKEAVKDDMEKLNKAIAELEKEL